jgi:hypothetical protein
MKIRFTIAALILGAMLIIGAVAVAATRRTHKEIGRPRPVEPPPQKPSKQIITRTDILAPRSAKLPGRTSAADKRHPRFFDPIHIFTGTVAPEVAAYPLADPPGLVVDVIGVPEPEEPVERCVAEDERIRTLRRRVTERGLRYVIGLEMPVQRIELIHEGGVVMVFPTS